MALEPRRGMPNKTFAHLLNDPSTIKFEQEFHMKIPDEEASTVQAGVSARILTRRGAYKFSFLTFLYSDRAVRPRVWPLES